MRHVPGPLLAWTPGPLNLTRPEVPAELAALVAKMMAKDPARRFQEPREVAETLKPFFKLGNAAVERIEVGRVPGRSRRRHGPRVRRSRCRLSGPPTPERPNVRAKKTAAPTAPEARWESLIEFNEAGAFV